MGMRVLIGVIVALLGAVTAFAVTIALIYALFSSGDALIWVPNVGVRLPQPANRGCVGGRAVESSLAKSLAVTWTDPSGAGSRTRTPAHADRVVRARSEVGTPAASVGLFARASLCGAAP